MKKIISINPATGKPIDSVNSSTALQINEKIAKAHAAALKWKTIGVKERINILKPLIETFKNICEKIALLTTQEIGKPISESRDDLMGDLYYLNDFIANGEKYIEDEIVFKNKNAIHRVIYEPTGVVACIIPWNYPFGNFIWAVIPNLIVGNTVVVKHSEECVLTARLLEEVMLSLKDLPEGVFSAIYGGAEEGANLATQNINMIWFTGSSTVGRKLAQIAGQKQIKAILEMGGSNPIIVREDAYIDSVERIYKGRFTNCGQVCDAIKRALIHCSLFENIVTHLVDRVSKAIIGDPEDAKTTLGPLVSKRQLAILEEQVQDALSKGAKLITGGRYQLKPEGYYYTPTILTNIKRDMRVWQEEVFGPVLPIVSFKNDEEAIELANDTQYGLGAVIISKDMERARLIASKIDAGCIDINEGSHWQPSTPFGGYKASGMGREHGGIGFQELCQVKVIAE
jgi:succinate-semialdehyde dehydrogenase/glutarate-semialdehyde dehydrogenase